MARLKRFKWVWIVVFNVVLMAILLEVVLRLAAPSLPGQAGVVARWVASGQPYAEVWTPAWQQNFDHYYALRPGIDHQLQYGSPTVSFYLSTIELWDEGGIGFRTRPVDYFVDAVVVGDSFGFCFTEQTECWVNLLEATTGLGIVNLSQPVTGSTSHARILRDFGQPLTPPLVIWQFFGNDFNDDYGLAVFRDEIEPLETGTQIAKPSSPVDWLRRNSVAFATGELVLTGHWYGIPETEALFDKPYTTRIDGHPLRFGGLYEQQALDMTREINQTGYELSRAAFLEAQQRVESWGGELVVVVLPTREEVYADFTRDQLGDDTLDTLASSRMAMFALCDELDLRCFDALPVFQAAGTDNGLLYYEDDMHLNAYGNRVLSAALADWLVDEGVMSGE